MNNYNLYEQVIAKRNMCVPAVLQMVLKRFGIVMDQTSISEQLGIVPDNDSNNPKIWGTHIYDNTLNDFFQNNSICLRENYIPINHFMDSVFLLDKLNELLPKETAIICGYNYSWLFGDKEDVFQHVSIIIDVNEDKNEVVLLDPGPKDYGVKSVSADKLYDAIREAHDGLWCIYPR